MRRTDFPDLGVVAAYVGIELLFWIGVALVLAYLAAPRGEGEGYAVLGAIAILTWLRLRARQAAARQAFLERARYHCEYCNTQWPSA
jgi:hypothetical protein